MIVRWTVVAAALLAVILVPFAVFDEALSAWSLQTVTGKLPATGTMAAVIGLLAADVVAPIPSSLVSTAAGASLGFFSGVIASILGMTLGSQLGYVLGRTLGTPLVGRLVSSRDMRFAQESLRGSTAAALVVMRAVPVLAEASVLVAGILRVDCGAFFVSTTLANIGISVVYCGIGAMALETNSFLAAFAGAIVIPAVAIRLVRRRRFPVSP